jgi:hypothetical protein
MYKRKKRMNTCKLISLLQSCPSDYEIHIDTIADDHATAIIIYDDAKTAYITDEPEIQVELTNEDNNSDYMLRQNADTPVYHAVRRSNMC